MQFDLNRIKIIETSRYDEQLKRVREKFSSASIEETVNNSIENIKMHKSKSFIIYGEPQSGKTELMICLTAKLIDEGHRIIIILINDNIELLNQNYLRFLRSGINPFPQKFDQIMDPAIKIGNNPWIIFCKKNTHNLQKLIEKIGNQNEKIIIDDEADYATPNSNINKDKDPTAINQYIGELLDRNAIYIGVTATPARLDLNNTYENDNQKWVYFPAHAYYTGKDHFFPIPFPLIKKENKMIKFLPEMYDKPKFLKKAFFNFIINVSYLNLFSNKIEENYSMLVHTSGKTDDHKKDYEDIIKIKEILNNSENEDFRIYLKEIWEQANKKFSNKADEILKYILQNKGKISIIVMNNKSKDDYEPAINPATPFTIAIGGNIISRGVTFNNLLSMFFTRDAHKIQQDTYIQRARMFGSRGKVLDFFELHIPKTLYEDWYKCFLYHRLSLDSIKNGKAPVWLSSRRIVPASKSSINNSIVSIDRGEISFNLFHFTDQIKSLWVSQKNSFSIIKEINNLSNEIIPDYLLNFLDKYDNKNKDIYLHAPHNISNQINTDIANIIREKGLFGGSELRSNSNYRHHLRIFYNNENKARVVYKYQGDIAFISKRRFYQND